MAKAEAKQPEAPEPTDEQLAQEQAEAEAAFSAGFHKARGEEPPTQEPDKTPSEPSAEAAKPEDKPAESPAPKADDDPEPIVLAGLTEAQLKAALAQANEVGDLKKQIRNAFGKFGELQSQITAAQRSAQTGLTTRQINAEALTRLKAEFPEIANLLAEDLSEVFAGSPAPSPTVTQEQIDARINAVVDAKVSEAETRVNERMLSRAHADWEDIAKGDDLKLWLSTQSPDYRQQFLDSRDAVFIANGLDKFKTWREQGQTQRQRNQRRLETAVNPRGSGPSGPSTVSDEEAFRRGFMRATQGL